MIVVKTVVILTLIPGLALAASPRDDDEPQAIRLTVSAATERIPLHVRGPVDLSVDGLGRRITLKLGKRDSAAAIAKQVNAHIGLLCPVVKAGDGAVDLGCRSRRIEAQLTREGNLLYLDINELRGLPWRRGPDAPPSIHYEPWRMGLGQHCPGHSDLAEGECWLKQGNLLQAAIHFRAALNTTDRQMATLRLGDVALSTGDPVTATGWYRRVGAFGPFGRVAGTRLCELDGSCLGSSEEVVAAYGATDLPEPLRVEMTLRAARAEAYAGRLPSAEHIIVRQARGRRDSVCRDEGDMLCRRILIEAMREAAALPPPSARGVRPEIVETTTGAPATGDEPRLLGLSEREYLEELMEAYLTMPSWEKGPFAVEMAQAAAPIASRLGATTFAGNLLASVAPEVPPEKLADHLLQASETFLAGQNWARARIVVEYAQTRLKKSAFESARWKKVLRMMGGRLDDDEISPATRAAIEAEMVATRAALKDARTVLGEVEGVLDGARAAHQPGKPGGTRAKAAPAVSPQSTAPSASPSEAPAPAAPIASAAESAPGIGAQKGGE